MFVYIFALVVVVLIFRKAEVPVRKQLAWSAGALLAPVAIQVVFGFASSLMQQSPILMVLIPFYYVFAFASPWIVFAMFNDKYSKPIDEGKEFQDIRQRE